MIISSTCPKCGAIMNFDRNTKSFHCDYCGNNFYYIEDSNNKNNKNFIVVFVKKWIPVIVLIIFSIAASLVSCNFSYVAKEYLLNKKFILLFSVPVLMIVVEMIYQLANERRLYNEESSENKKLIFNRTFIWFLAISFIVLAIFLALVFTGVIKELI